MNTHTRPGRPAGTLTAREHTALTAIHRLCGTQPGTPPPARHGSIGVPLTAITTPLCRGPGIWDRRGGILALMLVNPEDMFVGDDLPVNLAHHRHRRVGVAHPRPTGRDLQLHITQPVAAALTTDGIGVSIEARWRCREILPLLIHGTPIDVVIADAVHLTGVALGDPPRFTTSGIAAIGDRAPDLPEPDDPTDAWQTAVEILRRLPRRTGPDRHRTQSFSHGAQSPKPDPCISRSEE